MDRVVSLYLANPDKFVFPFEIKEKNNKVRTIITYKDDGYGKTLRKYHESKLRDLNYFYKHSRYSFAYRKKVSCRHALTDHLKSNLFITLDIHSFFESISLDAFIKEGYPIIKEQLEQGEVKAMFYKGSLSLGYVTSPIISDIYLHSFDMAVADYLSARGKLHYSRYCDDILISSEENDFANLEALGIFIEKALASRGLSLNKKKEKKVVLNYSDHNSLQFLGLSLSKNDDGSNKVTVSKHFIMRILDLLEVYYQDPKKCNFTFKAMILSRIAYLQYNSKVSYERFLKKHQNKFNKEYKGI